MRHSLAHLLGAAVVELYGPDAKLAIGPAIENGFYYDVELPTGVKITPADLEKIEKKMRELVKNWKSFDSREVSAAEAKAHFAGNPYKTELIDEIESRGEKITLYTSGNFTDLCRGGHVGNPSKDINPSS